MADSTLRSTDGVSTNNALLSSVLWRSVHEESNLLSEWRVVLQLVSLSRNSHQRATDYSLNITFFSEERQSPASRVQRKRVWMSLSKTEAVWVLKILKKKFVCASLLYPNRHGRQTCHSITLEYPHRSSDCFVSITKRDAWLQEDKIWIPISAKQFLIHSLSQCAELMN